LAARLDVQALDLVEQLVTAGLPQRQALGILDEAVRLGERTEQIEVWRGREQPVRGVRVRVGRGLLNATYDGAPRDGEAWLAGACGARVQRGGAWGYPSDYLRTAARGRQAQGTAMSMPGCG
jgi:hypothetical protein